MTDEEQLAQEIAEKIVYSQVSDIEGLTVSEMTWDHVKYGEDTTLQKAYEDEIHYKRLVKAVHAKVDSAVVGISWDEGTTWVW